MTTKTPDRIIEHWPRLSPDAQAKLTGIAEDNAAPAGAFRFEVDELAAIDRARDDFKHGRTLDPEQYRARMDAFMKSLAAKATT